jgi:putative membrane protein
MNEKNDKQKTMEDPGRTSSPAPTALSLGGAGKKTGIMNFISGITYSLGIGRGKTDDSGASPGDVATTLAHQRTDLAMERNYLAADRTLMAWIRTSLSMISFGFTIGKIGQVMGNVEVKGVLGRTRMVSVESIAYFLVIIGTVALFLAAIQHRFRMRELFKMGLRRQLSISFIVALLLIVLGSFALGSLILAL